MRGAAGSSSDFDAGCDMQPASSTAAITASRAVQRLILAFMVHLPGAGCPRAGYSAGVTAVQSYIERLGCAARTHRARLAAEQLPAVDSDRLPRDPARMRRCQEQRDLGHFFWRAQAAERNALE